MTDLIGKLASAIATAEGYFVEGSLPQHNNNPGDLRAGPSIPGSSVVNGFWVAPSAGAGIAALYRQIALDVARGVTLRGLVYSWAPPSDGNNSENYLQETARRTGLPYRPLVNGEPNPDEAALWSFLDIEHLP